MIIELMGARGIGKSTIISTIKKNIPNLITREGFRRINNDLDTNTYEGFIENQRQYLIREINEVKSFNKEDGLVLVTRGPHELLMYIDYIVKTTHSEWESYKEELKEEIDILSELMPYNIIYLEASKETILRNIMMDSAKKRKDVDFWFDFNSYEKSMMKTKEGITFLNVDKMDVEEKTTAVLQCIYGIIEDKKNG